MATILGLLANPLILQIALNLLDTFLQKKKADAETAAALVKIKEFLQANGVAKGAGRLAAEDQIATGDQMWNEREKKGTP